MPCEEYLRLKDMHDGARRRWAQFAYKENEGLWGGTTKTSRKQICAEEQENMSKHSKEMLYHREHCAECKKENLSQ